MLAVYFVFVLCYPVLGVPPWYTTFFKGDTCPDGWVANSLLQGRLIVSTSKPSDVLITVQKPLSNMENRVHHHTFESTFIPNRVSFEYVFNNSDWAGGIDLRDWWTWIPYNKYVWKQSTENSVSELPYVQLLLCTIIDKVRLGVGVPYGSIAYFPSYWWNCSDYGPWEDLPTIDGRSIIPGGNNDYYVSNGDQLQSGENRKHTHTFAFSFTKTETHLRGDGGPCNLSISNIMSGNTTSESLGIPYIQMMTCISTNKNLDVVGMPSSAYIFSTVDCPKGYQVSESYQGRYIIALPEKGTAGATFGGNPVPTNYTKWPTHKHNFNYSLPLPCRGCANSNYDNATTMICDRLTGLTTGANVTSDSNGTFPYVAIRMCESIQ